MPYTIHWKPQGVVILLFDTITKNDIIHAIGDLVGNYKFDSCRYRLIDLTKIEEIMYKQEDILLFASLAKQTDRWSQNAMSIFITNKTLITKQVNQYITQRENASVKIKHVHSIEETEKTIKEHLSNTSFQ